MRDYLDKYGPVLCLLLIVIYVSPYVILGKDAYITIHDNLDSRFVWYALLARESGTVIQNVMNGMPRLHILASLLSGTSRFAYDKNFADRDVRKLYAA